MEPNEFQKDPQPTIIPPQETPEGDYNPAHKNHVAPVRSFSTDLANAIRDKGGSVVRIAIAEEEKHRRETAENSATSRKNIFFIVATVIIVIAAIGVIAWVYSYKKEAATQAPVVVQLPSSIVSAETAEQIDATGMQIAEFITAIGLTKNKANIQDGTIKDIVVTQNIAGTVTRIPSSKFLAAIGAHVPDTFIRSLSPQYMLGVYAYKGNNPFIILQGTAHDFLLAGMLAWEPKLFNDMVPIFGIDTTTLTPTQLQTMPFSDTVIGNRDTRAVKDASGKPMLYYSFLDQDTIVIAADSKTLTEIVRRY